MSDLPYLEQLDDNETGLALDILGVLEAGGSDEALNPAAWHLLGRYGYYALGTASGAIDALVREGNREMDIDALIAVAEALREILTVTVKAVGEAP